MGYIRNTRACFPQSIRTEDSPIPREGVFYKYLVSRVTETPEQGDPGSSIPTSYSYEGDPVWAFDLSAFARPNMLKGWSMWLGFATTLITNGSSKTRVWTHRGWHKDQLPNAEGLCLCREERLQDGPVLVDDVPILAGRTFKEVEYGTVGGVADQIARSTLYEYAIRIRDLHGYWEDSDPMWAEVKKFTESIATAPGQFRQRYSETTYNDNDPPQATSTLERGWTDQEVRCSRTTYANNPGRSRPSVRR